MVLLGPFLFSFSVTLVSICLEAAVTIVLCLRTLDQPMEVVPDEIDV
jgi:hypothetical protein